MDASELDRRLREIQLALLPEAEPAPPIAGAEVSLSAGPFDRLAAVRAFTEALDGLPGVAGTEVRGYESADRALIDVQLR